MEFYDEDKYNNDQEKCEGQSAEGFNDLRFVGKISLTNIVKHSSWNTHFTILEQTDIWYRICFTIELHGVLTLDIWRGKGNYEVANQVKDYLAYQKLQNIATKIAKNIRFLKIILRASPSPCKNIPLVTVIWNELLFTWSYLSGHL